MLCKTVTDSLIGTGSEKNFKISTSCMDRFQYSNSKNRIESEPNYYIKCNIRGDYQFHPNSVAVKEYEKLEKYTKSKEISDKDDENMLINEKKRELKFDQDGDSDNSASTSSTCNNTIASFEPYNNLCDKGTNEKIKGNIETPFTAEDFFSEPNDLFLDEEKLCCCCSIVTPKAKLDDNNEHLEFCPLNNHYKEINDHFDFIFSERKIDNQFKNEIDDDYSNNCEELENDMNKCIRDDTTEFDEISKMEIREIYVNKDINDISINNLSKRVKKKRMRNEYLEGNKIITDIGDTKTAQVNFETIKDFINKKDMDNNLIANEKLIKKKVNAQYGLIRKHTISEKKSIKQRHTGINMIKRQKEMKDNEKYQSKDYDYSANDNFLTNHYKLALENSNVKYPGVCYSDSKKMWRARITLRGRQHEQQFSVRKFGFAIARMMAITWRSRMEKSKIYKKYALKKLKLED